jgi:hypothetical protein
LVKVGLGQEFDGIITTILCRGTCRCGVVKLEATTGVDMVVLGRGRAGKDFANEVDDCIATRAKFTNDLKLACKLMVIWGVVGDEAEEFTLEGNSLANNVAGGKDVLYGGRDG